MAKNISLLGASYTGVPGVLLPQTGGGTALFTDVGDTTATPSDVAEGKIFFAADGSKQVGTATGGTQEAITITDTEDSHGGTIREITGMTWYKRYLPPSAELVAEHEETINLSADTDWDSWKPSTTAKTLLAAGTTGGAGSYTIGASAYQEKAIIGVAFAHTDVAFADGTAMAKGYSKGRTIYCVGMYAPLKMPDYANQYYGMTLTGTGMRNVYWTSATATTIYTAATYGIGLSGGLALSTSSATGTSRVIGFTRPTLTARCNSTYFSTECAGKIDSANTNTYIKTRLYLIDKEDSILYKMMDADSGLLRFL